LIFLLQEEGAWPHVTKWILIVGGVGAGLLLLITLIGFVLPREHHVSSRITLHQPPDSVFAVIRDIGAISSWWPMVKQVSRRSDPQGREIWNETMRDGFEMGLEVTAAEPPRMIKTVIVGDGPFGGSWATHIESVPGGSTVTVTEHGWVSNPIFRLVSRLMGHHRTMDDYLTSLASRFGEQISPQHLGPIE
jgi:uncharacterized protein YndB with AHSA1/START domain